MSSSRNRLSGDTTGILVGWTAAALFLVLIGFNLLNYLQYKKIEPVLSSRMGERQAFETKAVADAIRPARIRLAAADSSGANPRYLAMQIGDYLARGGFNSVSILDTLGRVAFSTQGENLRGEIYPYIENDRGAFTAALSGLPRATELYRVGGRLFRGSYAPIFDESGRVSWILSVETGAEYFQLLASLRRNMFLFGLLSIVVAVAGGLILISTAIVLRRMGQRLLAASTLASMGRMAAGVAHDIRNPLAIIRGSAERLSKSASENQVELLRFISEEAGRIDSTIEDYLSIARSERPMLIKIGELVSGIIEGLSTTATTNRVTIETEIDDAIVIAAPKRALERTIFNLVMNSIEAMPDGGRIRIVATSGGKDFRLAISDNGPGISARIARDIFDPFFTTKKTGTGIGLTIAKKLIEDAGGTLILKSFRPGECSFEIAFPIRNEV